MCLLKGLCDELSSERFRWNSAFKFAWVKEDDRAYVSFPSGHVQARFEHLQPFAASLPMRVKTLREERKRTRGYASCKIDEGEIYFQGAPTKVIAQFVRVLNRIWPLMQQDGA